MAPIKPKAPRKGTEGDYPPLPAWIEAPGGKVTISTQKDIRHDDDKVACWGMWDESDRTIKIDESVKGRLQWGVFYHEATHVALSDSGLNNILQPEIIEAICDAVSTQRMRERFG